MNKSKMKAKLSSKTIKSKTIKRAIMGGSFNPFHLAHLNSLLTVKEKFQIDKIVLIPSFKTPLKEIDTSQTALHRLKMLEKMAKSYPFIEIDKQEISRKGLSYTYKSIQELSKKTEKEELFFIMGLDQFSIFESWKNYKEILKKTNLIVTSRPGFKFPKKHADFPKKLQSFIKSQVLKENLLEGVKKISYPEPYKSIYFLPLKDKDISSSDIRQRVKDKSRISHLTAQEITDYIKKNQLYVIEDKAKTKLIPSSSSQTKPKEVKKVSPSQTKPKEVKKVSSSQTKPEGVKKVSPPQTKPKEVKKVSPSQTKPKEVKKVSSSQTKPEGVKKVSPPQTKPEGVKKVSSSQTKSEGVKKVSPPQTKPEGVKKVSPSHGKTKDEKLKTKSLEDNKQKALLLEQQKADPDSQTLIDFITKELEDKKAYNIECYDMSLKPLPFSFILIASASNVRQTKALAQHIKKKVRQTFKLKHTSEEGEDSSRWIVLDYNDVVVHLFYDYTRSFYRLEELWGQAQTEKLG